MKIVNKKNKITKKELAEMSKKMFGGIVKAVIDIKKEIMAVDGEMHADEEQFLLEKDSKQKDLWGINLYPEKIGKDNFIEFDSVINIRPLHNNRSRGIDSSKIQQKIIEIVNILVEK